VERGERREETGERRKETGDRREETGERREERGEHTCFCRHFSATTSSFQARIVAWCVRIGVSFCTFVSVKLVN
jgi:hypothetical protein